MTREALRDRNPKGFGNRPQRVGGDADFAARLFPDEPLGPAKQLRESGLGQSLLAAHVANSECHPAFPSATDSRFRTILPVKKVLSRLFIG
jgi:hypothetical protein